MKGHFQLTQLSYKEGSYSAQTRDVLSKKFIKQE